MGNKIDDYLRKNYHKKVAYQDNYWLEMQAMLGPEKKDRKVIWLLLLLCVALSGYIIVDHLKDADQIRLNEKQSIVAKNTDEAASQLRQPSFVESERKENTIQSSSIKDSKGTNIENTERSVLSTPSNHISQSNTTSDQKESIQSNKTSTRNSTHQIENEKLTTPVVKIIPNVFASSDGNKNSSEVKATQASSNQFLKLQVSQATLYPIPTLDPNLVFIEGSTDGISFYNSIPQIETNSSRIEAVSRKSEMGFGLAEQINPYANGNSKLLIGALAGLYIQKPLGKFFSLNSGIFYQLKRGTYTSVKEVSNFTTSGFARSTNEYAITPQSLHYVKVPVRIGRSFGAIDLDMGIGIAYLIASYGYSSSISYQANQEVREEAEPEIQGKGFIDKSSLVPFIFDAQARVSYRANNTRFYFQTNYLMSEYSTELEQRNFLLENNPLQFEIGLEQKIR